jgi:hypothetical protein
MKPDPLEYSLFLPKNLTMARPVVARSHASYPLLTKVVSGSLRGHLTPTSSFRMHPVHGRLRHQAVRGAASITAFTQGRLPRLLPDFLPNRELARSVRESAVSAND